MKRAVHLVAAMVISALAHAVTAAEPQIADGDAWPRPMGSNLPANSGFEEDGNVSTPIPGWHGDPAVYSIDRANAHSGAASLRYQNSDPARYVLATQRVKLQPGASYEYAAWIRTENVVGKDSGAALCLEWNGADGKWMGGSYGPGIQGTSGWVQVRERVRVPADAVGFTLTCYLRKGMTGTAWFDDVSLLRMAEAPIQVIVTEPNYRGWILGDIVKARVLLNWRDGSLGKECQVTARLENMGEAASAQVSAKPDDPWCDLRINLPPLAAGERDKECNLVVQLIGEDGKSLARCTERLTRRAPTVVPRVGIDAHGRTSVDGQPYFPIGFYMGSIQEEDLKLLAQSKVNCIMPYASPTRQQMDLAQKYGLKVIYSTKDWYYGSRWSPQWLKSEQQEEQAIRERVREFRNHPALFAWYLNDELPLTYRPRLLAHQQWTASEDPDHPTWSVLYQVNEIDKYIGTCDVIGSDPYPIGRADARGSRPALAGEWARKTVAGMQHARPVWMVPQVFSHAVYEGPSASRRSPTVQEVRSMSWQCITEGATGLIYYSWFDLRKAPDVRFDEHWPKLREVVAEIEGLSPVVLSSEPGQIRLAGAEKPGWLHTLMRRHNGRDYAILVSDGDGEGPVHLEVPGARTANTLLGDAKLTQRGATVTVDLPKLGVAVIEAR